MGTSDAGGADKMLLSTLEIDAIGEVMNISMGSAATAVSQMLDKQVEITTPVVNIQRLGDIKYENYEPALLVKIVYTAGITGANVMVFRQHDMQIILNTLMGIPDPPSDDFVFDDLSISAACEVMNQMMGSSATALAEFLGKTVDISTPTATVMTDENTFNESMDMPKDSDVVAITFRLVIKGMLESEFVSVMTTDLAKEIISQFIGGDGNSFTQPEPQPSAPAAAPPPPPPPPPAAAQPAPPPQQAPPQPMAPPQAAPMPEQMQPTPPPAGAIPPQPAYPPPYGYDPYAQPPGGYPPQAYPAPAYQMPPQPPMPPLDVRPVEFPEFPYSGYADGVPVMGNNMDLIMNVPLDVSIEIGTTKRKIKDIMNFTSGTVVELDKQAGAPVDIVVNGQLIAHGDVVVIDDNFGVRITEIVGTKELINSLSGANEET